MDYKKYLKSILSKIGGKLILNYLFGGVLLKISEYIYGKKNLYDDISLNDIIEISLLNISKNDIANEFYLSNKSLNRLLTEIEKDY